MFNKDKYKSLVHYICHRADEEKLGSTKLNKILWFSEATNYLSTGKSITGETFKKDQFGPVPFHILPVINELENSGSITYKDTDYYGYQKKTYHCMAEPELISLSEDEKNIVDNITDVICEEHTATSISELSHNSIWEIAEQGEEIPLYATLVANIEKPNEKAINWARAIALKDQQQ